ncbi:mitochondrial ribosomal protein S18A [Oratosquilla oratoria]|uniref:mitochondrial ribosomal protein S18A n=1 Tax=Oratosquilla oratoria TaxID=337810 RepID=UPI003F771BD3
MIAGKSLSRLIFQRISLALYEDKAKKSVLQQVIPLSLIARNFSASPCLAVKEIHVTETGKQTTIEGVYVKSPRKDLVLHIPQNDENSCPLSALNLDLKHTDVLILSQFLRKDGCMLPRRITSLSKKEQKKVQQLVAMAQKAGLMSNLTPENSKKDPKKRRGSKKFNCYFDENTIIC